MSNDLVSIRRQRGLKEIAETFLSNKKKILLCYEEDTFGLP